MNARSEANEKLSLFAAEPEEFDQTEDPRLRPSDR